MDRIANEPWTETKLRSPESAASSSMQATPYATADEPVQPYPSRCMPSTPSLPSSGASSRAGKTPCSNHSPTYGRIRSSANFRTVSRISRSSSVSSSPTASRSAGSRRAGVVAMSELLGAGGRAAG